MNKLALVFTLLASSAIWPGLVACKKSPEITCKVNDQCFVCPNEKAKANCAKDPTSSRCKWAEPSHCK
ncbi:hypothetical protein AKJ09_02631 [Labilithrix luteola]|uniref:Lipoprotein n=1 Tax=Labilithrix luteola TaxID=1391654 RepID=A0A0K1PR17_9BACT|nr:hypothetical protein [Labilithrix luteola]AKU95967.1 hypothetical protein AKJ09_02631 [Labilithrix luteola]